MNRRQLAADSIARVTSTRFRCELRSRHPDRVEFHADQPAQSVQRAPAPGRSDRFVRALVSPVSALLRARHRTGGRTWRRGGCQLYLALGAGLCTRAEQTLPTASQTDEQELSDRRDLVESSARYRYLSSPLTFIFVEWLHCYIRNGKSASYEVQTHAKGPTPPREGRLGREEAQGTAAPSLKFTHMRVRPTGPIGFFSVPRPP